MPNYSNEDTYDRISLTRNILYLPFSLIYFVASLLALLVDILLPRAIYHKLARRSDERDSDGRIESMRSHVKAGDKVLDVGCGSGRFAMALQQILGVEVHGVDVVDYANTIVPIHMYDGKSLPFPNGSFDVVFTAFVFHHVTDQEQLMSELVRCARKKIVIFEDTYFSPWQHLFVMWNDYQVNILQGYIKILKGYEEKGITDMPMPFAFRNIRGWKQFFANYPVRLIESSVRHSKDKPHSKVMFCLELL